MMETLKKGSTGTDVKVLQGCLRSMGYIGADGKPLSVDGAFGSNTDYAVKMFQRVQAAYGVKTDASGVMGPLGWKIILG